MINILAPLSGRVLPLEDVPDAVFAQKMIGPGMAIDPTGNELKSPCAGQVIFIHPARHALTLAHESGCQILIHVGLDTVQLQGEGFEALVKTGDRVFEGQPLLRFDADLVAQKAKSLISVIAISEGSVAQLMPSAKALVRAGSDSLFHFSLSSGPATTTNATDKNAEAETLKTATFKVDLPTGLHARPTAVLVGVAKSHSSQIALVKKGRRANAKSLVAVLSLEVGFGDEIYFEAIGPDARQATEELTRQFHAIRESENKNHAHEPKQPTLAKLAKPAKPSDVNTLIGVAVSPGMAIGAVYQLRSTQFSFAEMSVKTPSEENRILRDGLAEASRQLTQLRHEIKNSVDGARAAIFAAHQELLEDPDILTHAEGQIAEGRSAAFAWNHAIQTHAERLAQLNNELLANRANDLRDVGQRVMRFVADIKSGDAEIEFHFSGPTVLIAENLTPSETVRLDRSKIVGFCTTSGGATSHVAILARSLGLPAIAGIDTKALNLQPGSEVLLDGDEGVLRLNPSVEAKKEAQKLQDELNFKKQEALAAALQPASTQDGHHIEVMANIGSPADAKTAVEMGCDGVGLLRSEFLFLERETAPSEEEQYRVYQEIADILGPRPLTIRTLDVGGDKPLKYLPLDAEENPFLGIRGIRIGLKHQEILRQQLRAILRVRSQKPINVMFPMIATLDEFIEAKQILEEERTKLGAKPVHVGLMIEVPSAALIAEQLAPEADFFSIGTNDLTQYTLAMDRGHKDLAKQVDALHPSVLKLIEMTAKAAHKQGKWVGVCGGLASDLKAVNILIGLGIDELSVSLPSIPLVKSKVREQSFTDTKTLAQKCLNARDGDAVRHLSLQG